jgi:hypothetical protein
MSIYMQRVAMKMHEKLFSNNLLACRNNYFRDYNNYVGSEGKLLT